jgi:hypothetical protein
MHFTAFLLVTCWGILVRVDGNVTSYQVLFIAYGSSVVEPLTVQIDSDIDVLRFG